MISNEEKKAIQERWEKAHDFIYDIQTEIDGYDGYFCLEESSGDVPRLLDENELLTAELAQTQKERDALNADICHLMKEYAYTCAYCLHMSADGYDECTYDGKCNPQWRGIVDGEDVNGLENRNE